MHKIAKDEFSLPNPYIFRTLMSLKHAETVIFRGIAQLVEQRSPKPRAEGSSPSAPAKN